MKAPETENVMSDRLRRFIFFFSIQLAPCHRMIINIDKIQAVVHKNLMENKRSKHTTVGTIEKNMQINHLRERKKEIESYYHFNM